MITTTSAKKSVSAVRFADMIPGKLYRFFYGKAARVGDNRPSSVLGLASRCQNKRMAFTVLFIERGSDGLICSDRVGDTWTGRQFETKVADFYLVDDVEVTIKNDAA